MGLLSLIGGGVGSLFGMPGLGGAIGGALEGGDSNGGAGTTTKNPWGPSQEYLIANLKKNAELQKYYEQNPFNAQQKTAYQNTFNDVDNLRNNVMPGLMQFANNAMTGSYQRPQYSRPGTAGYGGSQPVNQTPGAGIGRPFSVAPGGQFGQVDFAANNPFSAQNKPVAAPAAAPAANGMTPEQIAYLQSLITGNGGNQGGGY